MFQTLLCLWGVSNINIRNDQTILCLTRTTELQLSMLVVIGNSASPKSSFVVSTVELLLGK